MREPFLMELRAKRFLAGLNTATAPLVMVATEPEERLMTLSAFDGVEAHRLLTRFLL
jgi:hypothetical protein